MPVTAEDLVSLLAIITSENNYQITNSHRMKGGLITGIGATVGGVCGGPVGLVVGGLVGGSLAAWKGKSTSTSLDQFLMDMSKEQRAKASDVHLHEISGRRVQSAEFCGTKRQGCHRS